MNKKTILLTGTSGFIGYSFLNYILSKNYYVIDILRSKNKNNSKLNQLKKIHPKKYKSIFFSNYKSLNKKIKNYRFYCFINFTNLYKNNHNYDDIFGFVESNILFPTLIYDLISKKTKKIINFGTMMQHADGKSYSSKNLYAATKNAFEMINNYYCSEKKNIKIYNLKFYESFGENDTRTKLLPTLIKNCKKNKITKILSKNLELNIIHINDIINSIKILLNNNIKSGSYCLKHANNIKIIKLIKILNKNLNKKIKVRYYKKSNINFPKSNLKILPKWKPQNNLLKKIISNFKNEIN